MLEEYLRFQVVLLREKNVSLFPVAQLLFSFHFEETLRGMIQLEQPVNFYYNNK